MGPYPLASTQTLEETGAKGVEGREEYRVRAAVVTRLRRIEPHANGDGEEVGWHLEGRKLKRLQTCV